MLVIVEDKIMVPKDVHVLIPQTGEYCYLTQQKGLY